MISLPTLTLEPLHPRLQWEASYPREGGKSAWASSSPQATAERTGFFVCFCFKNFLTSLELFCYFFSFLFSKELPQRLASQGHSLNRFLDLHTVVQWLKTQQEMQPRALLSGAGAGWRNGCVPGCCCVTKPNTLLSLP